MFTIRNRAGAEAEATLSALSRSLGIIEFNFDGTVRTANQNFLAIVGYSLPEIQGQHHSLFVEPAYGASPEYRMFWDTLRQGEFQAARYKRLAKGAREIWIEATYTPVLDGSGKPFKVVKVATDITRQIAEGADRRGQIEAINKAQAVISFTLDGIVLDANQNFLTAVGYSLSEIQDRHHNQFVEPAYKASGEYRAFWAKLQAGEHVTGQFKRLGKDGREIWIEASYNPILDASGRPYKVVKFATDITAQVKLLADLNRLIEQNFGEIDAAIMRSDREAGEATQAAGTTAGTVQTMAAAAEELAASVAEISQSMAKSRAATDEANDQVAGAAEVTGKLSQAATAMSGIVRLIQTIAGQINLLALNATIESARAGEAGRGFAVVAQEVKNLANQAARATEQIGREIENVQAVSHQVVGALETIQGSVARMRDYVVNTAAAVEEQSVVTRDMSGNMQDAADAVGAIAHNILAISEAVASVTQAVETTKTAARVLAR